MPVFHVTVRHGGNRMRYHTFEVKAPDVAAALRRAADELPDDVARTGDIVEVRTAPDPEARPGG